MNWFKQVSLGLANARRASELAQDVQTLLTQVEELANDVAAARDAILAQERESAQMLTEWATTLDKISRWAARQSARERRDTDKKLDTLAAGPDGDSVAVDPRTLTKPQLRARAAAMRRGDVTTHADG